MKPQVIKPWSEVFRRRRNRVDRVEDEHPTLVDDEHTTMS
ncbi:hypothetical protein Shel_02880 [Slackia heliotrinireducens DSM 20476]|uniref:Uncharacterized protein n=1 Tax=Slackia heliotrinireducens (strain ATCC 29202 / DSM 20476 / NCTC 11029 / RHS 1) TaxID=471855 RepID=C7N250_SLAHD|nr:hypothetical protein Shel_02880 [Slackia heliotrinireducens DSM 20476]